MIPHRQIGKLIIQTDDNERSKLQEIYKNGLANGCTELRIINNKDLRKFEPEVKGINAIKKGFDLAIFFSKLIF